MSIITISRQYGSPGMEIATALKEELGFNYLNKEYMDGELVGKYEIPREKVAVFDEKKPGFWDSLTEDRDRYFHFMKTAVYEFACKGDCVIIGRGAQILFANVPGVFRIRIISPPQERIERIQNKFGYDERFAKKLVRQGDLDRAGFHKFFFGVNWEEPSLYDLIINTTLFSVETAVRFIKMAIEITDIKQPNKECVLEDLCLKQEVLTNIKYREKISVQFLEIGVENGVVTLQGLVSANEDVNRCETVVRSVAGVKDVLNEIHSGPLWVHP